MRQWLPRGLAYAALMVALRIIQGPLVNAFPVHAGKISLALMTVFAAAAVAWGVIDGRSDARANPDPDRRRDLPMRWLVAGMVAGVVGGLAAWAISQGFPALYASNAFNELTSFAAFTTLLLFVPAIAGVTLGRWLIDRDIAKQPQHHHGLAALEHPEHQDVFATVGAPSEQDAGDGTAPVATAETTAAVAGTAEPVTESEAGAAESITEVIDPVVDQTESTGEAVTEAAPTETLSSGRPPGDAVTEEIPRVDDEK